jgi:hypothetical protein
MHFLERYALSSGLKIDKPFIYEKFFPIPFDKYITLHPHSQYNSKNYDFWSEVLNFIAPALEKEKITIVQIGAEQDIELNGCYRVSGQTTINQVAYIIKNSMLHVGADSFPVHIASTYDKKIVALYSNSFVNCAKPMWGSPENQVLLEPLRINESKPSFSAEENPKTINSIGPEKIAKSILELLKLRHDIYHETVYYGKLYSPSNPVFETALETPVEVQEMNLQKILCRMDFNHNEKVLEQQLQRGLCEIVTNKPIDINLLEKYKNNIIGIIYHIEKNDNPNFAQNIIDAGIETALVSELSEEELAPKKIDYMDAGIIREIKFPDIKDNELKDVDLNKLYYRSNKITISMGKFYPSKWAWENKKNVQNHTELSPVPDDEYFWKECNNFRFFLETA